jgi:hypothetical protein
MCKLSRRIFQVQFFLSQSVYLLVFELSRNTKRLSRFSHSFKMKLFTSLVIFSSSAESYNSWNSRNTPDCTKSQTGKSCLPWDSRRNYTLKCNGRIAPGGCSNPDNDSKGAWCYTGYGTTNHYEYCDPRCSSHNVCATPTIPPTIPPTVPRPVDKCNETRTGKRCRRVLKLQTIKNDIFKILERISSPLSCRTNKNVDEESKPQ